MMNNQTDGRDEDLKRVLAAHASPPMTMEELVAIAPAAARRYQNRVRGDITRVLLREAAPADAVVVLVKTRPRN